MGGLRVGAERVDPGAQLIPFGAAASTIFVVVDADVAASPGRAFVGFDRDPIGYWALRLWTPRETDGMCFAVMPTPPVDMWPLHVDRSTVSVRLRQAERLRSVRFPSETI
jgi:hypothetical protein